VSDYWDLRDELRAEEHHQVRLERLYATVMGEEVLARQKARARDLHPCCWSPRNGEHHPLCGYSADADTHSAIRDALHEVDFAEAELQEADDDYAEAEQALEIADEERERAAHRLAEARRQLSEIEAKREVVATG